MSNSSDIDIRLQPINRKLGLRPPLAIVNFSPKVETDQNPKGAATGGDANSATPIRSQLVSSNRKLALRSPVIPRTVLNATRSEINEKDAAAGRSIPIQPLEYNALPIGALMMTRDQQEEFYIKTAERLQEMKEMLSELARLVVAIINQDPKLKKHQEVFLQLTQKIEMVQRTLESIFREWHRDYLPNRISKKYLSGIQRHTRELAVISCRQRLYI